MLAIKVEWYWNIVFDVLIANEKLGKAEGINLGFKL